MPTAYHSPSGLWATILAGLLACLGGAATISEVAAHGGSVPVFTTADPEKAVEQRTPLSIAVTAPVRGGSWIAYTAVDRDGTSSAYLVSADGSESREIRHGARPGTLREWSRDGSSLLFCGALDYASGAAGDECTEPFSVAPYLHDPASLTYLDSRPRLSPDGRTLAFVRIHDAEPHRAALMTVDLLSGLSAHVVGFEANVQPGIDWSPDGPARLRVEARRSGRHSLVGGVGSRLPGATNRWPAARLDGIESDLFARWSQHRHGRERGPASRHRNRKDRRRTAAHHRDVPQPHRQCAGLESRRPWALTRVTRGLEGRGNRATLGA
jgi:hypothetical protein